MKNKGDKEKAYRCHAKFIYNHGQKPTLTFVTPGNVSSVLYRFYPLLIVFDGALNNIMWICDDICQPFIHLVMIYLVINLLSLLDLDNGSLNKLRIGSMFTLWLGIMSGLSLFYAFAYYVLTVYQDLRDSEPPTLDDIVIALESVVDKLATMRSEVLGRAVDVSRWKNLTRLAILFTPIHYFLMRQVTIRTYVMWMTFIALLYHSTWFQCTMKLCWRVHAVRQAYYAITSFFDDQRKNYRLSTLIDAQTAISFCSNVKYVPRTDSLKMLRGHRLQLQLQKLYPWTEPIIGKSKNLQSLDNIAVIDFTIQENQRKWRDEGWTSRMLSYEKPHFCMRIGDQVVASKSPWEFQEGLPAGWEWLDDCWRPIGWVYSDSNWVVTGERDSLESFTRTKTWKRRIFKDQSS